MKCKACTLTAVALTVTMFATPALADIAFEDGATFHDNGSCHEHDGTAGIGTADGQCMTPADYDEIFSIENLNSVETLNPFDGDTSVAEAAGLTDDGPASVRELGAGLVDVPFTFVEHVAALHEPRMI